MQTWAHKLLNTSHFLTDNYTIIRSALRVTYSYYNYKIIVIKNQLIVQRLLVSVCEGMLHIAGRFVRCYGKGNKFVVREMRGILTII